MKTTSLRLVIEAKNAGRYAPDIDPAVQDAIAAAYWAGQSDARARERAANAAAKGSLKHRYHRLLSAWASKINSASSEGLRSERDELLSWTFTLPTSTTP